MRALMPVPVGVLALDPAGAPALDPVGVPEPVLMRALIMQASPR